MKLHVVSDLHPEFRDYQTGLSIPPPETDIIVVAGDCGNGLRVIDYLAQAYGRYDKPLIYVPGNHDFYHSGALDSLGKDMQEYASLHYPSFIRVLCRPKLVWMHEDVCFIGATLWTNYYLDGDPVRARMAAAMIMPDYKLIRAEQFGYRPATAEDFYQAHRADRIAILGQLETNRELGIKTAVITHHCPSARSVHESFAGSPVNGAFASDLEYMMQDGCPILWVHGHTHFPFDYEVDKTRVICNPLGYPGENPGMFDPELIVEV